MASALQPSEVSICVLASMYLPWHCSYPYGWCEQKGQAQTETELCLISRSDHFILGLKYTSRAQRGISTLQKCFVSRDVKAVLLTRINIQPTSGEFAGHCLGEGSQVLAGSSQRPHALVRDVLSRPFKSYLVQRLIWEFTYQAFFLSLKGVMV